MIPREVEEAIRSLEQSFIRWPGERRYRDECNARAALVAAIERAIEAKPAGEFVTRATYGAMHDEARRMLERAEAAEAERDRLANRVATLLEEQSRLAAALAEAQARIETARAHLGAAKVQLVPSDDAIIADHVRDAYEAICGSSARPQP